MKNWPNIRKLTLHWLFDGAYWQCKHVNDRWERENDELCELCDCIDIPFLDWLTPPFYCKTGGAMSLSCLHSEYALDDTIRTVLCLDDSAPLDTDDPNLLFWAREARNYPLVVRVVRQLAKANLALEGYEWFVTEDADSKGRRRSMEMAYL
ncbi:uncharacterized protein PHACADRAFT_189085 [Phanerochaete carnosa HHB-10118-sp]|uniref:Uncharacterized protein n=1 Tax=Phanerochaete carnosa (strain HHB-10118-sp) TaxID=650164 RepID=K5VPS1_PHACS|nr:uncharacterized protein PHACADRAFT_189085 [Phanerochaete carnosa HHB-10118-sp]EKM48715.1 hypothetical protein PHACADRAFT_189085 [Phanerochaete carnosa HHB-10118-sp]